MLYIYIKLYQYQWQNLLVASQSLDQVVDALLESGVDGEARGVYGKTAAHCAVQRARNMSEAVG